MTPDGSPHQTLGQIKALLASHDLRPRHRFGQNFLHDDSKMIHIIGAAQLSPGDVVLEVGPGTGALSIRLIQQDVSLLAVEIDHALEPILKEQFDLAAASRSQINSDSQSTCKPPELLITDVLAGKHEISPLVVEALSRLTQNAGQRKSFKLIANLPYNVASPLLINLMLLPYGHANPAGVPSGNEIADDVDALTDLPRMTNAVVTIQREVADRLAAGPGGKDYGPISVMIQAMYSVKRVTTLPPGCFWPTPKVESAVIALNELEQPLTTKPKKLSRLLHCLFSKRRKQIGSVLGRNFPLPDGIEPMSRPEQLTVEQLIQLSLMKDECD